MLETRFDVAWVEGASRSTDAAKVKALSNGIRGAVAIGQGFTRLEEFRPHLEAHSADVIQLDIQAVGITGALELADAAYGYELPVSLCSAPGNLHVHLSGAMPYFMSAEIADPVTQSDACSSDVRIEKGWAMAGDKPGNGLTFKRVAPARARSSR